MDGVISIIKPPGVTSHDMIGICRRILQERRIGHSGTLDPLAYGVLPIFVGRATRAIEYTESLSKTYVAECEIGYTTDTEDSTGNILGTDRSGQKPTWHDLEGALSSFIGHIEQTPSKYSAIKINGRRAYDLARAGVEFDIPSRKIQIHSIELLAYAYPFFTIRVRCSSGTYIRSLLRDICESLHIPGVMTQLCRVQVGQLSIENAITIEELEEKLHTAIQPVDLYLNHMPAVYVNPINRQRLVEGKEVPFHTVKVPHPMYVHPEDAPLHTLVRSYHDEGFMGILRCEETSLKVEKNIYL